ncbi:hypothetical protein [Pelomonas sp. CA6]|nr:hypothetical protein [Pelomonas sp. CA6]
MPLHALPHRRLSPALLAAWMLGALEWRALWRARRRQGRATS